MHNEKLLVANHAVIKKQGDVTWISQKATRPAGTICLYISERKTEPEFFNLPSDYNKISILGRLMFYKNYGLMDYESAKEKCAQDGSILPIPSSE